MSKRETIIFDITILAPRNHNDLSHYHAQNEMKMFLVEMKFEETYVQILQEILCKVYLCKSFTLYLKVQNFISSF